MWDLVSLKIQARYETLHCFVGIRFASALVVLSNLMARHLCDPLLIASFMVILWKERL